MHRNPWFTLVLGLMVGLVLGYVFAERQTIPPAAILAPPAGQQTEGDLPEGHPPIQGSEMSGFEDERLAQQAAELQQVLAQTPEDHRIMVALGNLYFDAERWHESRIWYERSLEFEAHDPNVLTDLAVVYRSLGQPETALEILDRAIASSPDHWQGWYNKVIVLHFDLHRHEDAAAALQRLEEIAQTDSSVPDLTQLRGEVLGS